MFDLPSSMPVAVTMLLIAGALLCIAGAVIFLVLLHKRDTGKKTNAQKVPESLPGGGGRYVMHLEGVSCDHCRANAEAALNAFPGIRAAVDLRTQTATVVYSGLPDLELLDKLKAAVEKEGFTVKEVR